MIFADRSEAGRSLAFRLDKYAGRDDVIVLGVPRGGLPVAFQIAQTLHVPLDVFLIRKLGVPGHEELAFGAIASGGVRVLERHTVSELGITAAQIETVAAREQKELQRQEQLYRVGSPAPPLDGKIVILADDGIATGASILAGVRALRQLHPAKIVVAAPVAPATTCKRLAEEVDELICVANPEPFYAVGRFYDDFSQVADAEVIELLARNREALAPASRAEVS